MNHTLSINSNAINIQLIENDNSITVRGHGPEGYVNRTVLTDDTEAEAKITALVEELEAHQRAELEAYIQEAPGTFEAGVKEIKAGIRGRFEEGENSAT